MNKVLIIGAVIASLVFALPLSVVITAAAVVISAGNNFQGKAGCDGPTAPSGDWRPPFVATPYQVTSPFGRRFHPVLRVWKLHDGIDLVSTPSPASVVAAGSGRVIAAGRVRGYGNRVIINHGGGIRTLYGHLATINDAVRPGRTVGIGQTLGIEGSTGYATGVHLHFTVIKNGQRIDPAPFMRDHGAPLDGGAVGHSQTKAKPSGVDERIGEGGVGFDLPQPAQRQDSLRNPPTPIPASTKQLYVAAGRRYGLPWTLLAGVGMEETNHGRNHATSSAGAQGLMQFMPSTFAAYGVDGDHDGRAEINDPADSVYSAANYLVASGALRGPDGVKRALLAYNHVDWYVGDVLYYAHIYGDGVVLGGTSHCDPGVGAGNPGLPPLRDAQVHRVLAWALSKRGLPYVMGANGPEAYDCSSFTRAAYGQVDIALPRTAQEQRDWLASGHGLRIRPGSERSGDLIFTDSYLGPTRIGHVAIVLDPSHTTTIEAANSNVGIVDGSYDASSHHIFEIWRPEGRNH